MNPLLFETQRLITRPLNEEDLTSFYDMQSNPNVMRHIKPTMNLEESQQELQRFIRYYQDDTIDFNIWAVVHKDPIQWIGICGVYQNDQLEQEIAYRLRERYWGKGFGKEIAGGLIQYCFKKSSRGALTAYARIGNTGSIKILEKEMNFVNEFYSEKGKSMERKYQISKVEWLQNNIP